MSTFLIKRGKRARLLYARAHLAHFNAHGEVDGAWCGTGYNLTSNVRWGLRVCKHCLRRAGY